MELSHPVLSLITTATAVSATRPTLSTHGVDVTTFGRGGFRMPKLLVMLIPDASRTLDSPTGGSAGPEVWTYINSIWCLVSYFRPTAPISVPAGGYAEAISLGFLGDRVAIAGTKSGGTINYQLAPVEYHLLAP